MGAPPSSGCRTRITISTPGPVRISAGSRSATGPTPSSMRSFWPFMPILAAAYLFLAWRRLLAYLRYFQQEGYETMRFGRWVNVRSLNDPAFWLSVGAAFLFIVAPRTSLVVFVAG